MLSITFEDLGENTGRDMNKKVDFLMAVVLLHWYQNGLMGHAGSEQYTVNHIQTLSVCRHKNNKDIESMESHDRDAKAYKSPL